jgi:hypothetical protein
MIQDYTDAARETTNCITCRDTGWKLNGLLPVTEVIEGKKYRVRCIHESSEETSSSEISEADDRYDGDEHEEDI